MSRAGRLPGLRPALAPVASPARRPPRDRAVPAAGFSLVELLIALAVLGVGLVLVGSLMVQAYGMLAQAGVQARIPLSEPVLDRLRAEIEGASAVDAGLSALPGWSRDRLTLVFPDGRRVRYETDGPRLVRSDFLPATSPAAGGAAGGWGAPRPVLGEVLSWRWQVAAPRLLTVEIVYRDVDPRAEAIRASQRLAPIEAATAWQTRRITAATRGGGLGWGW